MEHFMTARIVKLVDLPDLMVCQCGIIIHQIEIQQNQHDSNKKKQEYKCPVCKEVL